MTKIKRHKRDPPSWLDDPSPSISWFHDEPVKVYEGTCDVSVIRLWRENYRTLLDLEHLQQLRGARRTSDLTDEEIIDYVFKQGLHNIPDLARSIKMNGVRVPLILSHEGELLDGNRRFLACQYLIKTEKQQLSTFTTVPIKCIRSNASKDVKLKIIAEMNFLDQHKEEWPRHVRAQFAVQEFESARRRLRDRDKAYDYISYFLQVNKSDLKRFQAVLKMIKDYVAYVGEEGRKARQEAERFGRTKFHLFEEFYNKALSGSRAIADAALSKECEGLLYRYIWNQQLLSIINVREFAAVVRYEPARKHLKQSNGNFEVARSMYQDFAGPKKASARIIRFCEWLENLSNAEKATIPTQLRKRLRGAVRDLD